MVCFFIADWQLFKFVSDSAVKHSIADGTIVFALCIKL